jgi:hypothetical protein
LEFFEDQRVICIREPIQEPLGGISLRVIVQKNDFPTNLCQLLCDQKAQGRFTDTTLLILKSHRLHAAFLASFGELTVAAPILHKHRLCK